MNVGLIASVEDQAKLRKLVELGHGGLELQKGKVRIGR